MSDLPRRPDDPTEGRAVGQTVVVAGTLVVVLLVIAALGGVVGQELEPTVERTIEPTPSAPGDTVTVTTTVDLGETTDGTLIERLDPGVAGIDVVDDGGADELVIDESTGTIEASYTDVSSVTIEYQVELLDVDESITINGTWEGETETYNLGSDEIEVTTDPIIEFHDLRHPNDATTAETINVSVDVENRGGSTGTVTVELLVDGAVRDDRTVEVEADTRETVTFDSIHIGTPGTYELQVRSTNASISGNVTVGDASGSVRVADQAIGTNRTGSPAIAVSDVVAESGWHLVATRGADGPVIGSRSLDDLAEADVVLPVDDGELPGPVEVHLVALVDEIEIGEPISDDAEVVASDDGRVLDATVKLNRQTYVNEAPSVTVDQAAVRDGGDNSTPYVVALHRRVGESLREVVATSSVQWGSVDDLEVPLDDPIAGGERLELAAVLYFANGGTTGEAIGRLDSGNMSMVRNDGLVEVSSEAILAIEAVEIEAAPAGEPVEIAVTVRNEGRTTGSESLWLSVGPHVDIVPVSVPADETTTVTSTWETDRSDAGIHDVLAETRDDTHADSLTVPDPASTPTSTPTDDQPGLGVAIAITAFVIAALLGHRVRD